MSVSMFGGVKWYANTSAEKYSKTNYELPRIHGIMQSLINYKDQPMKLDRLQIMPIGVGVYCKGNNERQI